MEKNSQYLDQLKQLVLKIQTRNGRLESNTDEQLAEASKWKCPDKEERKLLDDFIMRAKEFIELEKVTDDQKSAGDKLEKYTLLYKWFTSLNMLVGTFDVPLREISFSDMSLKE
jgi:hypothetical protein